MNNESGRGVAPCKPLWAKFRQVQQTPGGDVQLDDIGAGLAAIVVAYGLLLNAECCSPLGSNAYGSKNTLLLLRFCTITGWCCTRAYVSGASSGQYNVQGGATPMTNLVSGATCKRVRQPMHRMAGWTRCAYNAHLSCHNRDFCAVTATACSSHSASAWPSVFACQSRATASGKPSPSSRYRR